MFNRMDPASGRIYPFDRDIFYFKTKSFCYQQCFNIKTETIDSASSENFLSNIFLKTFKAALRILYSIENKQPDKNIKNFSHCLAVKWLGNQYLRIRQSP